MAFMTVVEALERCAAASGRNAKIAILDEIAHMETFREVVLYAKNPMWAYHLTVPAGGPVTLSKPLDSDLAWSRVRTTLDGLREGELHANDEMKLSLERICRSVGSTAGEMWLRQIVNHELKIGINDFERWFPGMLAKSPVMLCGKWEGEALPGNWIIEPKFDGYRAAVVVDEAGNVEAISRGNKEFWNWSHIKAEIKASGIRGVVLDGEFYAGNFGLTSSICKSQKKHKDALQLKYHVFDMLTLKEWNSLKCSRHLGSRKLEVYRQFRAGKYVQYVAGIIVEGMKPSVCTEEAYHIAQIQEQVNEFYAQGYEGAVLKDMSSVYEFDRSDKWLKIKPQEDADLEIIGFQEGRGRLQGKLGAFIVRGAVTYKKKQYEVTAHVGGGYSDDERRRFWPVRRLMVGQTIEVVFQDVTEETSASGKCASLRFPRFIRVRDDK